MNKCLLTPDRKPTDQIVDTTKTQLEEPMCFIGIVYRNMGKRLPIGAEMTFSLYESISQKFLLLIYASGEMDLMNVVSLGNLVKPLS